MISRLSRVCRNESRAVARTALSLLLFVGCSMEQGSEGPPPSAAGHDTAATVEGLHIGDRGPEVRAVYDYLNGLGYFPNDALADRYANWQPLLAEAPADPEEFDELFEEAVRGYQRFNRLPVTGVVDARTSAQMEAPRCGNPDSFERPGEKFNLGSTTLGKDACAITQGNGTKELTFRIDEPDPNWANAFIGALQEWERVTSLRFRRVTSGGCVILKPRRPLTSADGASGTIAVNLVTSNNNTITRGEITVGTTRPNGTVINWNLSRTPVAGQQNARLTMMHEIGHGLGLQHSAHFSIRPDGFAVDEPVMAASNAPGDDSWFLTDDDWHGEHLKTNTPSYSPTTSRSMDVTRTGIVWDIDSQTPVGNGYAIRCNGQRVQGEGLFIAADNLRPWHVNKLGDVYRNREVGSCAVSWERISAPPLSYIAANGDGLVWALGRDVARNQSERLIYVFNGSTFVQFGTGYGTRIAVDYLGTAYHTNQAGEVYVLNVARNGWNQLFSSGFENVHAGKNSFVWLIAKSGHISKVINATMVNSSGQECSPPSNTCAITFPVVPFWGNVADATSDGDSRIFLREGLIPTDGSQDINSGSIITFR